MSRVCLRRLLSATPASLLCETVRTHWKTLLAEVAERSNGGSLPGFVTREFERYPGCGILPNGFARVHCDACGTAADHAHARSHVARSWRKIAEGGQLADPAQSPDEALAGKQVEHALEQAIRVLEPMYREVLLLRDVEGLTAPEVAEVLGVSVQAVKSRLHRARLSVRA